MSVWGQVSDPVFNSIYQFEFQAAGQRMVQMNDLSERAQASSLKLFLYVLTEQNEPAYESYTEQAGKLQDDILASGGLNGLQLNDFLLRHALYQAVASGHFGEYRKAGTHLVRAYRAYQTMQNAHPAHPSTRFASAFFDILSQQVPDRYRGALKLAGLEVSRRDGYKVYQQLFRQYKGSGNRMEVEAGLFWLLLLWEFSEDPGELSAAWEEVSQADALHDLLVTRYLGTMIGFKAGQAALLDSIFSGLSTEDMLRLPYFYYQRGKFRIFSFEPDGLTDLERFLTLCPNANFNKAAMQKIAWYYDVNEWNESADKWYQKVLDKGPGLTWADEQAFRETKNHRPYNRDLLSIRMLYDGGQYNRALLEIEHQLALADLSNTAVMAELYYRKGRCLSGLGRPEDALTAFGTVLDRHAGAESYVVPKSAVLMAQILIDRSAWQRAESCLELAEQYNRYGYQRTFERQIDALRREIAGHQE